MRNLTWIVITVLACLSCGDTAEDLGLYVNGVVVVNQGPFLTGTGTLTFKSRNEALPIQNAFSRVNDGTVLGNVAQSMFEIDNKHYVAINNGGKIVVVEDDDFALLDTISGISQSRFFAGNNSRLFVSSWGADGISGAVHEIDIDDNSIEKTYVLGNGPEGMVLIDDKLYVAKGGGFGRDSTVVVIDINSNEVVKTIVVGDNPEQIVRTADDELIVICNGYTDFLDSMNSTEGSLVKIKDDNVIESIVIPNGSSRLALDENEDMLYFNLDGNVVKKSVDSNGLITEVVHEGSAYALAFDDKDDWLYIGDAKNFASQGEVFIYDRENNQVDSFLAGIVPSYFHFRD